MHYQSRCILFASLLFVLCFFFIENALVESDGLVLETEQHWETYRMGGTCISGVGGNIFVADVDGDKTLEIITGGHTYYIFNGTRTASEAPLKIWNWNGQNLTLEKSHKWNGNIRCLFSGEQL